ncbi:hypothetical protein [[Phormidium] sp. ETS-05]|nr:hypothetical protein [[Phormidium] sp. ETS-05]
MTPCPYNPKGARERTNNQAGERTRNEVVAIDCPVAMPARS